MEKELLEILDKARQSGASKEQLQGIVDAYKLKKKDSPQPYQPTSEEPTEVSKTDSESIDLGVYPTAFTPEEDIEAVKTSSKAKGYGLQDEEITKGRQAGFVLEKVDELSTKVSDWDLDAESNPDVFAFTSPTQEQVSAAEWGPTQFYQGAKGELGEPTVTEEERRKEYARNSRIAFGDDKYLFVQKELEQAKPELDKRYQELSGYDREEFVVEQPDGSLAIDPNALTEVQFFSDQFAQAHKEEVAKQEERYREKGRLGRGAGLVGQGFENLYYGVEGWFDPEDAAANTAFTGAKLEGAKRAMGLSEEEIQGGVIKNIGDGKVGSALTNLYAGVMSNIPQIAVGVASSYVGMPNVGMATLGASAGGAKYAQIYDNPNIPTSAKYLMAAQVAVTETLTERLAMGDINAAKAAVRGLSKAGRKELALRTAKNFIQEAKIPLKVGTEEAIEEGIAGGAEALMDNLVTGEPIDMYSIGDAMAIGFASGSGTGSAKVLTSMPSYVGSYKTANRRRKVLDSLTKLREAQNDPNVTQDEIDILQKSVDDAKLELVKIAAEDQQLYDKMSNEDVESIIKINRQIARGLDKLETISNDRAKSALKSQLQNLHKEKGNIEGKYRAEQAPVEQAEGAENTVITFAERIAKGEDVSSAEDIQFYENNKQEVEDALRQMQEAEEVVTETVEEQPTEMEEGVEELNSVNPTGSVFAEYTPEQRMNAPLGENMVTLDKTIGGNPDDIITIYRGAEGNEIVGGDYVTTNKQLAQDYAGTGKVVEMRVRKKDVIDDKTEGGGEEYIYRPQPTEMEGEAVVETLKNVDNTAIALDKADEKIKVETQEDGSMRLVNGSIDIRALLNEQNKKNNIESPSKIDWLPNTLKLFHVTKYADKIIKEKSFANRERNIDTPIDGVYFTDDTRWSSTKEGEESRFGTGKTKLSVDINNDGLVYFDDLISFEEFLKKNGIPSDGRSLEKKDLEPLISKGVKGILLKVDFASQTGNELIVLDESIIKNIKKASDSDVYTELPKSFFNVPSIVLAEAYHKAKADGSNPELVKAVEELLTKQEETDALSIEKTSEVPVQPEAEVSGEMEEGVPNTEPQEATQEGKKPRVAKDKKTFTDLIGKVFGLNKGKSKAVGTVADRIVGTIAERAGITKEEAYRRIGLVKADKKLMEQIQKNPAILFQVIAFHGSPYQFDKFLTEAIGTGEGAQAFGWGLYFTDLESIARNYAKKLSGDEYTYDGKSISKDAYEYLYLVDDSFGDNFNETTIKSLAKKAIDKINNEYIPDLKNIQETSQSQKQTSYFIKVIPIDEIPSSIKKLEDVIKELENIIGSKEIKKSKNKNLYKVSLHKGKTPDQYTWLEWDKPLNKQRANGLISKLTERQREQAFGYGLSGIQTEGEFYKKLANALGGNLRGGDKNASLFLLENGIDGIKYPAESISRGATSDTARGFNYVVFDENAVRIEEVIKFQKDAVAARGAMMMGMDSQAIIYALTDPNVSTPLHELAHVYEHYLTEQERADIEAWSGHKSGTVEFSEAFARGFEKFLAEGKAPNDKLQKLFDNFKKWLTEIYDGITGSEIDLELNDKMRGIYDAMLEGENKETARRRQRNTIKEKIDKSVVSKLPFLAKFNPEHSYTVAQAELIDKFIDEYVKTGSLKGSGNVEALINGVSNMASLKQKAKTGFRKIFFKFSYDSKDVNKIRAMSSSTLIAELFGSGFEKVLSAIGGTKWDASVAKSIKDSSNFIANIKPSMDKASATDVGQAGDIKMFAVGFVEQIYQRFVADVGEETAIKTAIRFLEKSIQTQQESRINSETLNLQKEALDLIKDETTIEGVLSKLTDGQRAVYESVIKANDLSIDEVQRISIENGKPLEKQNRYLHIPTRTTKNELKDLTPEEFLTDPDAIGYVNPFDTKIFEKTSGAQEARVKDIQKLSQAFEEGSLYLEPSFILQQHNSFFNTRLAVYSHQAIVQMNAALGAKEARDIFGGKKHNGAENISAVKDVIKRNMNANRISAYTLSNIPVIGGLYMSLKRNAIPLAMGSIVQPIKQGTVVITTAAELTSMVGRREAGSIMARSRIFAFDYFSEKARSKSKGDLFDFKNLPWNDLIMNSQVGVRNTLDALEFSDQLRNISIISSFAPARALRKKWNSFRDYWSAKSIVTPDRAAAQIGWLNYYEAYMIKNGLVEPSSFYKDGSLDADAYRDWYLEQGMNPNQDAVAYASNRILQYQGPSTQFERSELQGAKDFNSKFWNASYRLIRDTLFAMQSFSFGTSSTQMSSILQLAGKDFTKEDKRKALISLAGIGTSFAVFNGINVLLYKPLLAILTSLISEGVDMVSEGLGLDDDDENELNEKLKTLYQTPEDFRRALSIGATNTIIESSLPFLSQIDWAKYYVAYGVDFMAYSLGYTLYGEEMVKKYGDFGGGGFTVWQESSQMRPQTYKPRTDIGYLSIVPEDAYELYKIFNAGVTGEYDNGFGTKVYLNEKQREDAFKIAGFMAFGYGIPAIPATTSKLGVDAFRGVYHKASDNYLAAWMDDFTSLSEEKKKEVSEDFINNMNNYYKEQYDKILSQYGDEAISTLKAIKAIEYDIQDYSSTSAVKAMFAALDGKEKASEGNIDAFLFNLSNRNITPIAKGNIINQRLKKFDDKKERNEYYGRFVYSGLFLYNMDELRAIMNHVAKLNEGGNDSK